MPGTLSDENGSVMLFTMMFILIITVMGLIATQTSVFEIKIAENARRYNEEFAGAEAALNDAIANFRNQGAVNETITDPGGGESTKEKYNIAHVLNDTKYSDYKNAVYINDSPQTYPEGSNSIAIIEIRRIVNPPTGLDCSDSGADKDCDICDLSEQANTVPELSHRYYAGSIDKRRFAVTATAYKRNSTTLSTTWVQKGISLPAEQDKDVL